MSECWQCDYCGKQIDSARPYICDHDEYWAGFFVAGGQPPTGKLHCGPGCAQAAGIGGMTRSAAAQRPQGWTL